MVADEALELRPPEQQRHAALSQRAARSLNRAIKQLTKAILLILEMPSFAGRRSLSDLDARARLQSLVAQTVIKDHVGGIPPVALPTIALAAACIISQAVAVYAAFAGSLSVQFATALCFLTTYVAFTPMHDACHGSVASEPSLRFVNEVVGTACGVLFPLPFAAFKRMHLLHHKHTNEDEDPDAWAAKGPFFLLPLRWISIEVAYYSMYVPRPPSSVLLNIADHPFRYIPQVLAGRRPRSETLQSSTSPQLITLDHIQWIACPMRKSPVVLTNTLSCSRGACFDYFSCGLFHVFQQP